MAQRTLSGISGNANLGTFGGGKLNRWEVQWSTDALDSTGFGSVWRQRVVGMMDLQGRIVGYLTEGSATDNPGIPNGQTTLPTTAVVSLTGSTDGSAITATVIVSNVRITVDQNNTTTASRVEFNFMNAGAAVEVAWAAS